MPEHHALALPEGFSPDDIDAITELAALVARIQPPQSLVTISGTPVTLAGTGTTPNPSSVGGSTVPLPASINLKDFPTATDHLKHKIQRARTHIKALPDMSRTIAEQEEEIRELEEKMRRQKDTLAKLKDTGVEFGRDQAGAADKMEL